MQRWFFAILVCLPLVAAAVAEEGHRHDHEYRQLDAHEHGSGNFYIAIEDNRVDMELRSPGADIVGFEYEATTDKQKAAVARAKAKLKDIANVVRLPTAAGCEVDASNVQLIVTGKDKKSSHSEFYAEYLMTCAAPEKLVEIRFSYFKNFKGSRELEVTVAGPKAQQRFEVGRDAGKIDLSAIVK